MLLENVGKYDVTGFVVAFTAVWITLAQACRLLLFALRCYTAFFMQKNAVDSK